MVAMHCKCIAMVANCDMIFSHFQIGQTMPLHIAFRSVTILPLFLQLYMVGFVTWLPFVATEYSDVENSGQVTKSIENKLIEVTCDCFNHLLNQ